MAESPTQRLRMTAEAVPNALASNASAIEAALWADFDAFIEPREGAQFPPWLAQRMIARRRDPRSYGAVEPDPSLAAYLIPLGASHVWAIPGTRGSVSTGADDDLAGGVCGSVAHAEAGRLITSLPAAKPRTLIGLVPDDTESVRVSQGGGRPTTVAVANNVWTSAARAGDYTVAIRPRRGAQRTVLVVVR